MGHRPVKTSHLLGFLCIVAALVSHTFLNGAGMFGVGSGTSTKPATDAYSVGLREAYQQGFDDALAGLDPRPPKHISTHVPEYEVGGNSRSGSSTGGFGIGSILRYGMLASYVYRIGAG